MGTLVFLLVTPLLILVWMVIIGMVLPVHTRIPNTQEPRITLFMVVLTATEAMEALAVMEAMVLIIQIGAHKVTTFILASKALFGMGKLASTQARTSMLVPMDIIGMVLLASTMDLIGTTILLFALMDNCGMDIHVSTLITTCTVHPSPFLSALQDIIQMDITVFPHPLILVLDLMLGMEGLVNHVLAHMLLHAKDTAKEELFGQDQDAVDTNLTAHQAMFGTELPVLLILVVDLHMEFNVFQDMFGTVSDVFTLDLESVLLMFLVFKSAASTIFGMDLNVFYLAASVLPNILGLELHVS